MKRVLHLVWILPLILSVFAPLSIAQRKAPDEGKQLIRFRTLNFSASQLGLPTSEYTIESVPPALQSERAIRAEKISVDPLVLSKSRYLRPARFNQRRKGAQRSSEASSRTAAPTLYAACISSTESIAKQHCPFPHALQGEGYFAAWGFPIVGNLIHHRWFCRQLNGRVVNSNMSDGHLDVFDGWSGSRVCPQRQNYWYMDRNYAYFGYLRYRLYQSYSYNIYIHKNDVHWRMGVNDSCNGPIMVGQPHECGSTNYDIFFSALRPNHNPPWSNSDCWFRRYGRQIANYSFSPPVVSPCWLD